ncbi:hypothetical protein IF1G_10227 [Cordyceps javanica]|uniref:Uncharacterized protein n=1 Tax=Cordyceps javanica TaxID=43265 RepID=A0A545UNE8_9HYPO|nr:hypothetical protein IF1G_10227 [Cordyceps javanica]
MLLPRPAAVSGTVTNGLPDVHHIALSQMAPAQVSENKDHCASESLHFPERKPKADIAVVRVLLWQRVSCTNNPSLRSFTWD